MIKTRYKELTKGRYRIYFDNYNSDTGQRKYKFTKLTVSKDYSKPNGKGKIPKFTAEDRTTHNKADQEKAEWLDQLNKGIYTKVDKKVKIIDYIDKFQKLNPHLEPVLVSLTTAIKDHTTSSIKLAATNNAGWVKDFNSWLRINRAFSTRKNILWAHKRVIRDAVMDGLLIKQDMDEAYKVPTKDKPEVDIKYYTKEEVETLKKTNFQNEHLKQAFLFSCATGLRYSDLKLLRWSDIEDGVLTMFPYKTRNKRKQISIKLTKMAVDALEVVNNERNGDLVFWQLPDNRTTARLLLRDWAEIAGVPKGSPHWSRHTFAVLALNSGIQITTVQELMGHSDLKTTLKYAKLLPTTAHQEMDEKFPQI